MLKLLVVNRRRADLSAEEFRAHWCGPHAELVKRLRSTLRITRYVQYPVLDTPLNDELAASIGSTFVKTPLSSPLTVTRARPHRGAGRPASAKSS